MDEFLDTQMKNENPQDFAQFNAIITWMIEGMFDSAATYLSSLTIATSDKTTESASRLEQKKQWLIDTLRTADDYEET